MKSKNSHVRFFRAAGFAIIYFTLTMLLLCSPNSFAGKATNGVIEISQKDIPLVITKPGSYRLVNNLKISSPDVFAISLDADNVTVDLNGFTISGPGRENGGFGFGITNAFPRCNNNVVVRGGTIQDFGYGGVHLCGDQNRVENVHVYNTVHAIFVGRSSVVINCQVAFCYNEGINTDDGTMVLNNTIYSINGLGIMTSGGYPGPVGGVMVMGNNIRLCGTGIKAKGQGNRIEGNTVTQCTTGIDLSEGSQNYFAKNLLQGNSTSWSGESDDIDGCVIDSALSNIVLP